jgi:hypothetical protein
MVRGEISLALVSHLADRCCSAYRLVSNMKRNANLLIAAVTALGLHGSFSRAFADISDEYKKRGNICIEAYKKSAWQAVDDNNDRIELPEFDRSRYQIDNPRSRFRKIFSHINGGCRFEEWTSLRERDYDYGAVKELVKVEGEDLVQYTKRSGVITRRVLAVNVNCPTRRLWFCYAQ